MRATASIRLPDELTKRLDEIAKETERPRSFHIQKALEVYVEDFADLRIAIDRLRNPKDDVVSSKELRKNIDL
jgi:RHH-type rel operon transcriptional repressor/antitoxin RelB